MTEFSQNIPVDSSIAIGSLEQMRTRYVRQQRQKAEKFITASYVNGVDLWKGQQRRIQQTIDEAGGIDKIKVNNRSSTNLIKCKDGTKLPLSRLLKSDPVPLPLPENLPTFPLLDTKQNAHVQLSFGGNSSMNVRAFSTRYDLDGNNDYISPDDIEAIAMGDYRPTEIGITEAVTTESLADGNRLTAAHRYLVIGRLWDFKLREEFAPDPHEKPAAYAAWRAEAPLPRLDITFQATQAPAYTEYGTCGTELPYHVGLETYYSDTAMTPFSLEGAEKMTRMGSLLNMLWQLEFDADMPMPTDASFMPPARALQP